MTALDALGSPVRREILTRLRGGSLSVAQLASGFDVSRPAISRHLKVLSDAGLVDYASRGREHVYELRPEGFASAREFLDSLWDDGLARFKMVAENLSPSPADSKPVEGTP